ncbi:MAG TPA: hypothetical protein VM689_13235 [Aliidongia sp.]|nr:hypothetical protein [Aliidongia sp.]
MRRLLNFLALAGLGLILIGPVESRASDSLSISDEEPVVLKGKVVDIVCELAHDCTPNCGGGKRQLGVKTAENKIYFASKGHVIFAGLTNDLIPYCGQEIIADGLTTSNFGSTLLFIQRFKTSETGDWIDATRFRADWAKAHGVAPDSETAAHWFKTDPVVRAAIEAHGKLGLVP